MIKHLLCQLFLWLTVGVLSLQAQDVTIHINSNNPERLIDPKIYGQLFEHIYFSANNGLWNEMIHGRSFEPEQYSDMRPVGGFFDGWYADDDILCSPTRNEQTIPVATINSDHYEISMDINWRAYRLANRTWSGGLLDIRFAFKNQEDGEPYFLRIENPAFDSKVSHHASLKETIPANFSISTMIETEREVSVGMPGWDGEKRVVKTLQPLISMEDRNTDLDGGGKWHNLRIRCEGEKVKVFWDHKQILEESKLENAGVNNISFGVNYTETFYKNIRISSIDNSTVYFEGIPDVVKLPGVAPQWKSFGDGAFEMVKGDAVNMNYSQKITAGKEKAGVYQEPQYIVKNEKYIGSVYAKGDGQANLSIAIKSGDVFIAEQSLGMPGKEWQKYEFILDAGNYEGDAVFALCVNHGTIQVDQVSMMSQTGKESGGYRPDIYQTIRKLNPPCYRWPGGGYASHYDWKWGIGLQEERQRWSHWIWNDYDHCAFGTDEFLRFCRNVNAEPIIVVRVGYDRPESEYEALLQNACDWVAYCNEPVTGQWGRLRAANGHPEPYNVKYWEIDNEMWEMGIERYEKAVCDFSQAMRKIDPDIKIIACGGYKEDEAFLNRSGNYFDYLSLHHYERTDGYASGPEKLRQQYEQYADLIANCPNPNIKLYISEWNLQSTDWRTGLFAGGFLNMCEQSSIIEIGAAALFMRRTDAVEWDNAFINFDYKDVYVAPNYLVTKLWYDHFSRYRLTYTGDTGELNIATTLSEEGSKVIVKIVNPGDTTYNLTLKGDWSGISDATYTYYAPGSLLAKNTMNNKHAVSLKNKDIISESNAIVMTIEPYSAGVLLLGKTFK